MDVLTTRPGVLDENISSDVLHLAHDIKLAEPVQASGHILDCFELAAVLMEHLANGVQPVVDEPAPLAVNGGFHATTPVMAHNQNVPHLQHVDSKLQHRKVISPTFATRGRQCGRGLDFGRERPGRSAPQVG